MNGLAAARRYVAWLEGRALAIVGIALALVAGAGYLIAFHLPLYSDLSYLLPQDADAVRGLRELEARVVSKDTTIVIVEAPDAKVRAAAAAAAAAAFAAIDRDLVERVETDDLETRAYIRAHRHLFVPLDDLIAARDALGQRIADAKIRANPLFIDLEDSSQRDVQARDDQRRLDELRAKRREAEARLDRSSFVSADGRTAMILIKTTFNTADTGRARRLLPRLQDVAAAVRAAHPGVTIGLAGGVPTSVAEYEALVRGMVLSILVTAALVGLVLLVHLRTGTLLALLGLSLVIGTILAFGLAAVTVGHLNAATAFLGSIIAGNGINYGILLIARYLEERRTADASEAIARAIHGTLRPTLVAALGAAVAYGALITTSFAGFADFGVIAGAGMLVCWAATYVVLPALVLRFARHIVPGGRDSRFSSFVRIFEVRRPVVACVLGLVITASAGAVTWRYVADDPFEYDMTKLRSEAPDAVAARHWMKVADDRFGRGLWTRTYLLVDHRNQVPAVVAAVHRLRSSPDGRATIGSTLSILDVVPADQPKKLAVLAELRALLDDPGLDELDEPERTELRELRPPESLRAITVAELPAELQRELTERDGQVGNLILIRPAATFDDFDGRQFLQLAAAIRSIDLGDRVTASGASLIFADIITTIRRDGPRATAIAAIAVLLVVMLVVGLGRRAAVVLGATFAGTLVMVAACALVGLKVNFLDFVALPITLGLGLDYAINVADRADRDDCRLALQMTGSTVLVCSLTTIIGYASLLVSANLAIRGFGLASLIGEVTCVLAALVLVPALMALGRPPGRNLHDS